MLPTAGQTNTATSDDKLAFISHLNAITHSTPMPLTTFCISCIRLKQEMKKILKLPALRV